MIVDQVEEAGVGSTKVEIKYDPEQSAYDPCMTTNLCIKPMEPIQSSSSASTPEVSNAPR